MAPNLVTLIGTVMLSLPFLATLWYSPDFLGGLPPWVCLLGGVSLFAYSTLDAIDGKQARRTNSSSPLGQLFDHGACLLMLPLALLLSQLAHCAGCDALAVALVIMPISALMHYGTGWQCMAMVFSVLLPFFLAQWEEYHLHVIRTNVGGIGVMYDVQVWVSCAHTLVGWRALQA